MGRLRRSIIVFGAIGLVAGFGVGAFAQSEEPSDQGAALVTGRIIHTGGSGGFAEESEADGTLAQRVRSQSGRSDMNDPRLSGDVLIEDNADRFCDGPCSPETIRADVLWGTIGIENDGGTWTGTSVGTTDTSGGGGNITFYELVGNDGYEGLSAVIFERETPSGWLWDGVIIPGDLPPER